MFGRDFAIGGGPAYLDAFGSDSDNPANRPPDVSLEPNTHTRPVPIVSTWIFWFYTTRHRVSSIVERIFGFLFGSEVVQRLGKNQDACLTIYRDRCLPGRVFDRNSNITIRWKIGPPRTLQQLRWNTTNTKYPSVWRPCCDACEQRITRATSRNKTM